MNKQTREIDVFSHESRVEAAKETCNQHLSKDELLKQYLKITKGYEALIKEVKKQTLTGPPRKYHTPRRICRKRYGK